MVMLKIYLFGVPRFEREAENIGVSRRKAVALLAYLAGTAQPHSRDELATLLWPENDQSGARANLRRELSRLKSTLGSQFLIIDREQASINPAAEMQLDVRNFQEKIAWNQNHGCDPQRICAECQTILTQAVALYTGDFMAGFSLPDSPTFDDWQFFQSESLRQSLGEALQKLVAWHRDHGEYERGIEQARRWLALDNLHEPAHVQLMQLYAWAGQQSAAIRQYQECVRLLDEELGLEPDEETKALYETIKTRQLSPPPVITPDRLRSNSFVDLSSVNKLDRDESRTGQPVNGQIPVLPEEGSDYPAVAVEAVKDQVVRNLPSQTTRLVGRKEELAEITHLLLSEPDCRLLTLIGPGGSGKTRLAVQAAALLAEQTDTAFPDGVRFVPLAPLSEAASIETALAKAIGFSFYAGQEQRRQQLLDHLQRKHLLLLLDNFEHLLEEESVQLISAILTTAPGVKLLITSRSSLNARGEHLFPVEGLRTPPENTLIPRTSSPEDFKSYDAIQLFHQSAMRILPGFEIDAGNLADIIHICQVVQGMPLAIELAATWLEVLTPAEIATEIECSLDFLETDWYDIPQRQRSLRAVFDSSWKLLTEQECGALEILTIFKAGFTWQAVQAVTGAPLKTLLALAHKSWLKRDRDGRFQIHELLRQYATEKLQSNPNNWQRARERHSNYYAAFLNKQFQVMKGHQQKQAFNLVATEFQNIHLAWHWLVERGQLNTVVHKMLPALFLYCEARGKVFELIHLLEQTIAPDSEETIDSQLRAILLTARASFYTNDVPVRFETFGLVLEAEVEILQQAWALALEPGYLQAMGYWGALLAYLYGRIINLEQGILSLRLLLPRFRELELRWELGINLYFLGALLEVALAYTPEDISIQEETKWVLTEAQSIFQALGDGRESGNSLRSLGNLYMLQHELPEAIKYWQSAREKLLAAGERFIAADIYWQMGDAYLRLGEHEQAFHCYRIMSEPYIEAGHKAGVANRLSKESYEAVRYSDLDFARQLREQTLALTQEIGYVQLESWSTWEMGELQRVSGDLVAAREWFERSRAIFEKLREHNGLTFYHRGLGDIAQAQADYAEAQRQFSESLRWAQETRHLWGETYALCGLGRAEVGLQLFDSAHQHFAQALSKAKKMGEPALMLVALYGFASLYAAKGESERSVELSSLVIHHRSSWRETRSQAAELLEVVKPSLRVGNIRPKVESSGQELFEVANSLLETRA